MPDLDLPLGTARQQQVDDLLAGAVAEQLAEMLLVKADPGLAQQADELRGRMRLQGMADEARVTRQVAGRVAAMQVGEVAAPAARDADLFADAAGMVQHPHPQAVLAQAPGAVEARGAGPDHDDIQFFHLRMIAAALPGHHHLHRSPPQF